MLNTFADTFELSPECDNYLRSAVPADVTYEVLRVFTETDDLYRIEDRSSVVIATARRLMGECALFTTERISGIVLDRCRTWAEIQAVIDGSSVVQAMHLADDFCDHFDLRDLAEKELKFAIPVDSMIRLIHELFTNRTLVGALSREFVIVSNCRRIRHARGIDPDKDMVMGFVPVDRSSLVEFSKPGGPSSTSLPIFDSSHESFPLNMKSVWAHSGPELVFVLPLCEVERIVNRWLARHSIGGDKHKFLTVYPFDCVLRALRAAPSSATLAQQLIDESLRTKDRFKFCSLQKLRNQIDAVVAENNLSEHIRSCLISKISLTYAYLIVFSQVSSRDCKILSKGANRISLTAMRKLMNESVKQTCMDDDDDDESDSDSIHETSNQGKSWTQKEWDDWDKRKRNTWTKSKWTQNNSHSYRKPYRKALSHQGDTHDMPSSPKIQDAMSTRSASAESMLFGASPNGDCLPENGSYPVTPSTNVSRSMDGRIDQLTDKLVSTAPIVVIENRLDFIDI